MLLVRDKDLGLHRFIFLDAAVQTVVIEWGGTIPLRTVMAEKRPKSILSSLKNMLHREPEKASEPAPRKSSRPAQKKKAEPAEKKRSAPASAEAPAQEVAPEPKPDKKKTPNQPWYRHRQRW